MGKSRDRKPRVKRTKEQILADSVKEQNQIRINREAAMRTFGLTAAAKHIVRGPAVPQSCMCAMYARAQKMQRGYLGNSFELMCVIYSDACVRVRREQKCEWFRSEVHYLP